MSAKTLTSIKLTWDKMGNISHELVCYTKVNDYQKSDAELLSTVLLTSNQLGILSPYYALHVCERIFNFLEDFPINPEIIDNPLNKARIDLIQKKDTLGCVFEPEFINHGRMEPKEAVSRLLGNLPSYFANKLDMSSKKEAELLRFFRNGLIITTNFYLTNAYTKGLSVGLFSRKKFDQLKVQRHMLIFTDSIFPQWFQGLNISNYNFTNILRESKLQYKKITSEL